LPEAVLKQTQQSERASSAWYMHAPETLCLGETIVGSRATKSIDYLARPQNVDRPVDPHLAKAFS
jgi:hypothetical protein